MYLYLCVLHLSVGQCCRAWFGVWSVDIAFGRNMVCNYSLRCLVMVLALAASPIAGQQADSLSQEQLNQLTEYRQQHRRLVQTAFAASCWCRSRAFFVFLSCEKQVDGRLCAAAFVQVQNLRIGILLESVQPWFSPLCAQRTRAFSLAALTSQPRMLSSPISDVLQLFRSAGAEPSRSQRPGMVLHWAAGLVALLGTCFAARLVTVSACGSWQVG